MAQIKKWIWKLVETDELVPEPPIAPPIGTLPPVPVPPPALPALTKLPVLADWNHTWTGQLPATVSAETTKIDYTPMDHPYIGGKFTLFVLGFADHLDLLDRCISSIRDTCPQSRFDLRVALNQPSVRVESYVNRLIVDRVVTKAYIDKHERKKYPAMREMFWDAYCPINTPYLCWFDDDSWCRKNDWMLQLSRSICLNHPQQGRLYGAKYTHDLMTIKRPEAPREAWFQNSTWWRKRPLYAAQGQRLSPNGSQIVFASGGFWALATHVIREADIPDRRLNHNGGDITIGCQVTQAGYKVIDFSPRPDKAIIAWSDAPRRGYHENFPWG